MAGMDAVFKISQTTYRDRKIRAKNSVKEFFALISLLGQGPVLHCGVFR